MCCCLQFSLDVKEHKHKSDADKKASQQHLQEFTLNMSTGAASQRLAADVVGDFPSIPRHLVGKSTLCSVSVSASACLLLLLLHLSAFQAGKVSA